MTYTLTGKIVWVGKVEESLQGNIKRKIQIVIQDKDKQVALWIFNDNIEKFLTPVELGDKVTVEFSVKSNQYKDKWYTNCYCLTMEKIEPKRRSRTSGNTYRNPFTDHACFSHFTNCYTPEDIKKRYRDLCKKYHPDKGGDEKIMQDINSQYDKLK